MKKKSQLKKKLDQMMSQSIKAETSGNHKKLILLSFDALSAEDWHLLKQHPNFNKLITQGKYSNAVKSVYPSLTYPAHASVVTGKLPRKHGIVSNTKLQPMRPKPDWYWYHKDIHGKTLFSEAQKKALTVAAILWPVSGKAPIAYNMPEIFPNRPWLNQIGVSLMSGRKRYQILMNERHGKLRSGLEQPQLDNYGHACALDTLMNFSPDLLMVHYTDLDTQKHQHGIGSQEVKDAVKRLDQRLGDYFRVLKQIDPDDTYTLVVFGDHGVKDVHTAIRPNVILQKEGFLSVEDNGKLHHCDFIFKGCDGSAYLYHHNLHRVSREIIAQELEIIKKALMRHNEEIKGIKQIRTGAEAGYDGADTHALLMLEAEEGYYFLEDYLGDVSEPVREDLVGTDHWLKATHGYHPDSSHYASVFFAMGAGIEKGDIGPMHLVDIGPTMAMVLDIRLGDTDGTALW